MTQCFEQLTYTGEEILTMCTFKSTLVILAEELCNVRIFHRLGPLHTVLI